MSDDTPKKTIEIRIIDALGNSRYVGFLSESGKMFMVRCPECCRENHVFSVVDGVCAWCQFVWCGSSYEKEWLHESGRM